MIHLKNITKRYDHRTIAGVSNITFDIHKNEFVSLLGPSGAGKTTLLNIISKNLQPDSGDLKLSYEKIGYLSQDVGIETQKTVKEFLSENLTETDDEEKKINQIRTILMDLDLTNQYNSIVSEMSGGQKQRVLVARALVNQPDLLLLDEPFSHLDHILKKEILDDLFKYLKEKNVTTIWVTHSVEDALSSSSKILLLNFGELQQIGTSEVVYNAPTNAFTANYLGLTNIIPVKVISFNDSKVKINLFDTEYEINHDGKKELEENIFISIRPEAFSVTQDGLSFQARDFVFKGSYYQTKAVINDKYKVNLKLINKIEAGRLTIDSNQVVILN